MVDKKTELYLFPREDSTLIMVSCDDPDIMARLDQEPYIKDYSWWNSTDKPDAITETQWEKRESAWMEALPGAGRPADRCLLMEITPGQILFHKAATDLAKYFESLHDRSMWAARQVFVALEMAKYHQDSGDHHERFRAYVRKIADAKNEENLQAVVELADQVRPLLQIVPEIISAPARKDKK